MFFPEFTNAWSEADSPSALDRVTSLATAACPCGCLSPSIGNEGAVLTPQWSSLSPMRAEEGHPCFSMYWERDMLLPRLDTTIATLAELWTPEPCQSVRTSEFVHKSRNFCGASCASAPGLTILELKEFAAGRPDLHGQTTPAFWRFWATVHSGTLSKDKRDEVLRRARRKRPHKIRRWTELFRLIYDEAYAKRFASVLEPNTNTPFSDPDHAAMARLNNSMALDFRAFKLALSATLKAFGEGAAWERSTAELRPNQPDDGGLARFWFISHENVEGHKFGENMRGRKLGDPDAIRESKRLRTQKEGARCGGRDPILAAPDPNSMGFKN